MYEGLPGDCLTIHNLVIQILCPDTTLIEYNLMNRPIAVPGNVVSSQFLCRLVLVHSQTLVYMIDRTCEPLQVTHHLDEV